MRVLLAGYGPLGLALLRGLLNCGDPVEWSGILQGPGPQEGSDYARLALARRMNYPVWTIKTLNGSQFLSILAQTQADTVLVGTWGERIHAAVLAVPGVRFINCHGALLPRHRGPNPYTAAILAGDTQSGVTFHLMDSGLDTGPILHQAICPILPDDTGGSLRERCAQLAQETVQAVMAQLNNKSVKPIAQEWGSYFQMTPQRQVVDLNQPVEVIDRQLRALWPWYPLTVEIKGRKHTFKRGRMLDYKPRAPVIARVWNRLLRHSHILPTRSPQQWLLLEAY